MAVLAGMVALGTTGLATAKQEPTPKQQKHDAMQADTPVTAPDAATPKKQKKQGKKPTVVAQQPQVHSERPAPNRPIENSNPHSTEAPTMHTQTADRDKPVVMQSETVPAMRPVSAERRVPAPKQKQLIANQQRQVTQYHQRLQTQNRVGEQRAARLQQQRRMEQFRYQQEYLNRIREQQLRLQNARNYDYDNDPYFYTEPSYRYLRAGRYYQTNEYGAELMRRAVSSGYEEGLRAGLADREDRWRYSYRDSYSYQDANYGYDGFYVDQATYNYYFREGFRRGYDDSYHSRNVYGSNANGTFAILGAVLTGILNLQALR